MVLVAVAGGASPTLGRSIVTAIREKGDHEVVILSRLKPMSGPTLTLVHGAAVRLVDYDSLDSLKQGLRGVHTLISVIKEYDQGRMVMCHQTMLEAAKAAGVRRFAPSEFGMGPLTKQKMDWRQSKQTIWELCRQSGLHCTRFSLGIFMNYLGQGCPADRREAALAGLDDYLMLDLVDIQAGHALIPITDQGQPARISMCELGDVGRFVAAALNLDEWQEELSMVGSTTTMDEVVWMAERMGRLMKTQTLTKKQAQQRIMEIDRQLQQQYSLKASRARILAQTMEYMCDDQVGSAIVRPILNDLCPEVQPMPFDEYLTMYWSDSREQL